MTVFRTNLFLLLKHRQVLLEIFSKNYRVRRNMIQSRLTQECGEDLSKQEVDKVLKVSVLRAVSPWLGRPGLAPPGLGCFVHPASSPARGSLLLLLEGAGKAVS